MQWIHVDQIDFMDRKKTVLLNIISEIYYKVNY